MQIKRLGKFLWRRTINYIPVPGYIFSRNGLCHAANLENPNKDHGQAANPNTISSINFHSCDDTSTFCILLPSNTPDLPPTKMVQTRGLETCLDSKQ